MIYCCHLSPTNADRQVTRSLETPLSVLRCCWKISEQYLFSWLAAMSHSTQKFYSLTLVATNLPWHTVCGCGFKMLLWPSPESWKKEMMHWWFVPQSGQIDWVVPERIKGSTHRCVCVCVLTELCGPDCFIVCLQITALHIPQEEVSLQKDVGKNCRFSSERHTFVVWEVKSCGCTGRLNLSSDSCSRWDGHVRVWR